MHGKHNDLLALEPKVDGVWESRQNRTPGLSVNEWKREWIVENTLDQCIDRHCEPIAEAGAAGFVPLTRLENLVFSLGAKDNSERHS